MRKIGLIVVLSAVVCSVWAVPARRGGVVKTQPDGSKVTVYQHGDEHFHWMTNGKGEWLQLADDGYYRVTQALSTEEIRTRRMASVQAPQKVATTLNIAPRGLVVLVNFKDQAFVTSKAEMDSMIIGKNYTREYSYEYQYEDENGDYQIAKMDVHSKGSAWQYFYESSNGQYSPQFDVVGPVTVSKELSYYGKNDKGGSDLNPQMMVKEACELVDDSVDFAQYDNNNDGKVDFVYVIYAGYGEADGASRNTIWPHSWKLSAAGLSCKLDGKRVDLYACGNELDYISDFHTGIGTFCHEFSHVLGLPDLYVTNDATHKTLDEWDIMDYGPYNNDGNTPPAYSAYERFFMGWLTPELITEPEHIVLKELQGSNYALLIATNDVHNLIGNDPDSTRFYLLENRQQVGWDEYLPGHGLMLTKIQYSSTKWSGNTVNNSAKQMGVDLIEADNNTQGYAKPTDLFPAGATEYLEIENHPIEDIVEKEGIIYFKYKGGKVESATENTKVEKQIIAIYNILGQKQETTDVATLPRGTYVVVTSAGNHKIVR